MNGQASDHPVQLQADTLSTHFDPPRRFSFRTVLIPLLFLGLHWIAINLTATLYLVVYAMLQNGVLNSLDILGDITQLNQLLNKHYPVISVIYSALLIPLYLLFLFLQRRQDRRSVWFSRTDRRQVLPALAVTVGLLGLINIWFNLLTWLGDSSQLIDRLMTEYIEAASAFSPVLGYFWLILGISILTPITEELLFRGIIQGELRKAMPEWAAVVFSTRMCSALRPPISMGRFPSACSIPAAFCGAFIRA